MATLKEYRDKTPAILDKDFLSLVKKVQDLKFSLKMGKLKDVSQFKKLRKEGAQIKTIISEKRILEA